MNYKDGESIKYTENYYKENENLYQNQDSNPSYNDNKIIKKKLLYTNKTNELKSKNAILLILFFMFIIGVGILIFFI